MARRSTSQSKIDEAAFPVRLKLLVPETGFRTRIDDMRAWLVRELPRGAWAWWSGSGYPGRDSIALYFCTATDCARFVQAFPDLDLADATTLPVYSSPAFPHGRKPDAAV